MNVAGLEPRALKRRLRTGDLRLRTGPVAFGIRSGLDDILRGISLHYAQYTVETPQSFADFHVSVERTSGLHGWAARRAVFRFDGMQPLPSAPTAPSFSALEGGLDWCMVHHCHQYLIVRAAVLERGGRALILPAPSGSGKSTLCAALTFGGGWRLLSDELALIDTASGCAIPLPRPLCLENASIDAIFRFAPAIPLSEVAHNAVDGRIAYATAPTQSVLQANEHAVPAWVVFPQYSGDALAELRPLSRGRAFMALVDNAFNYSVHGRAGFNAVANLIDRCECHEFYYRSLPEAVLLFDRLSRTAR